MSADHESPDRLDRRRRAWFARTIAVGAVIVLLLFVGAGIGYVYEEPERSIGGVNANVQFDERVVSGVVDGDERGNLTVVTIEHRGGESIYVANLEPRVEGQRVALGYPTRTDPGAAGTKPRIGTSFDYRPVLDGGSDRWEAPESVTVVAYGPGDPWEAARKMRDSDAGYPAAHGYEPLTEGYPCITIESGSDETRDPLPVFDRTGGTGPCADDSRATVLQEGDEVELIWSPPEIEQEAVLAQWEVQRGSPDVTHEMRQPAEVAPDAAATPRRWIRQYGVWVGHFLLVTGAILVARRWRRYPP